MVTIWTLSQHKPEQCSTVLQYLRSQYTDNYSSQLFMLSPEASHVIQTGLQLSVCRAEAPHHLEILLPLSLNNVSEEHL